MSGSSGRPSLVIADDHAILNEGLGGLLRPHFDIVAQIHTLEEIEPTIKAVRPDVVLLDLSFDGESSLPSMRKLLKEMDEPPRFVVLTAYESSAMRREAARLGAHSYLLKAVSPDHLRMAIEAAAQNRPFDGGAPVPPPPPPPRRKTKTPRRMVTVGGVKLRCQQVRVLLLLGEGLDKEEIADQVGLTVKGVEYNVTRARQSMGIKKSIEMLRWVVEHRAALTRAIRNRRSPGRLLR